MHGVCICTHVRLYYHQAHTCRAVLCVFFRLERHVSESPHLDAEAAAAVLLRPQSPKHIRKLTQQRPLRRKQNRRGAPLTGSHDIGSVGCVGVCEFSQTAKPRRDDCQSAEGLMGVGWRDEGMEIDGWRREVGDEGIAKSWQLLFFFPDRVYTHDGLEKCLLFLIVSDFSLHINYDSFVVFVSFYLIFNCHF